MPSSTFEEQFEQMMHYTEGVPHYTCINLPSVCLFAFTSNNRSSPRATPSFPLCCWLTLSHLFLSFSHLNLNSLFLIGPSLFSVSDPLGLYWGIKLSVQLNWPPRLVHVTGFVSMKLTQLCLYPFC